MLRRILSTPQFILLTVAFVLLSILFSAQKVIAQGEDPPTDLELANQYAPILYFHPAEIFRPQSVEVLVNTARLRQSRRAWFDVNVLQQVSIADLIHFQDPDYVLDAWYGDSGTSEYINYSAHRQYYEAVLHPDAGGPEIIAYAHVERDEVSTHITIQYWLFYYYNDWFNKHEGDWEMIEVILDNQAEPEWLVLSQHHGGTRRTWDTVQIEDKTHPVVYVALGSHANYFWGDESYPNGKTIGNLNVEIMDRTGDFGRVMPKIILIPDREQYHAEPGSWLDAEWIFFGGHWGELAAHSDFGGPLGPADKGLKWEKPYAWGRSQALDINVWYANRLRVTVQGLNGQSYRLRMQSNLDNIIRASESHGGTAILHRDLLPDEIILAEVETPPGVFYNVKITIPDSAHQQVTHYTYEKLSSSDDGIITFTMREATQPVVQVSGRISLVDPSDQATEPATWDAPEVIWLAGLMAAGDLLKGIVISLSAAIIPSILYIGVLYWADRYEKEPKRLLAAAFAWGAIPAILVAIFARIFFQLPSELLGPVAIEAIQAGVFAPLIEELLKGAIIVIIARRFALEFDNLLDGIIYGAMVGFGFAMTGNIISYVGAFLFRGFAGLSNRIFIQGILYACNHAFYSAIFGAGLGYARLMQNKKQRNLIILSAFLASVFIHSGHSMILQLLVGYNVLSIFLTWLSLGVLAIAVIWSLRRQRKSLIVELESEVPEEVIAALTKPGRTYRSWRILREQGLRSWRQKRRFHQVCGELAQKKMQYRLQPDDVKLVSEIEKYRQEIRQHLE